MDRPLTVTSPDEGDPLLDHSAQAQRPSPAAASVDVRRQANNDLPVFRLPAEILVAIFEECRKRKVTLYTNRGSRRWQWISCTHVCHHWRTVALAATMLWSNVLIEPAAPEEAINAWLTRSGSSPLALTIRDRSKLFGIDPDEDPEPEFSESKLQSISQGLSRAKYLDISMHHQVFMSLDWPDSVPSVQHLEMYINYISPTAPNIYDTFSRNLPTLFPALKCYHADGRTFDFMHWTLPPTLTKLHLFGKGPHNAHELSDVINTLRQLPRLESLVLLNAMPYDSPHTNFSSWSPVALPFLQFLHLTGPLGAQIVLLDILKPGPSVRLTLYLLVENFEQAGLLSRPSFSSWLRQIPPPVDVAIAVADRARYNSIRRPERDSGGCEVSFIAWSTPQTLESVEAARESSCGPYDTLIHITFALHDKTVRLSRASTRDLFSPLERVLSSFPLSNVDTLVLDCKDGPVFNAPRVYHKMTALRRLHFHMAVQRIGTAPQGHALHDILQQINLTEDLGDRAVVFPQLATFIFSGIQFCDAHDSFLEALQRRKMLLESRKMSSDKVQIRLLDCFSLDSSYIEKLGDAATVEWDGLIAADESIFDVW